MSDKTLLQIEEIATEAPDTITIHFVQPEEPFIYLSGQFLTLICDVDGKEAGDIIAVLTPAFIKHIGQGRFPGRSDIIDIERGLFTKVVQ